MTIQIELNYLKNKTCLFVASFFVDFKNFFSFDLITFAKFFIIVYNLNMEIDAKKILMLSSKLNNLIEGFDEFYLSKKTNLTIKDKLLVFLLDSDLAPYELIKLLGIAKSNLALIIADLVKKGYAVKKHDTIDKRNIVVSLTLNGKIKANKILESLNKNINNSLAYKNNGVEVNNLLDELIEKINN